MRISPLRAIRAKCLDCVCGSKYEVRLCASRNCPLYPYRMGHKPKGMNDTPDDFDTDKTPENPHFYEDMEDDNDE